MGISVEPFAYPCLYAVGGNAVRVNANDVAHFRNDGAVWEEGAVYRYAEILKKNRAFVRLAFSMEGNRFFYGAACDFPYLSKGGVACVFDCFDGVFVHPFAVLFQQTLYGGGNEGDRQENGRGFFTDKPLVFLQERGKIVENLAYV